jgi:sugar phosphate isomerase/epimerase
MSQVSRSGGKGNTMGMGLPHAHIPYEKLNTYKELLRNHRINLEIFINSRVLDTTTPSEIISTIKNLDYLPEITIHGPFMDLSPGAVDSKIRIVTIDRFKATIDIALAIDAKAVVFHSGYEKWKYGLRVDLWLEESLKTWREMLSYAGGLLICIENIFEDEPSNLRLLMENLDSPDIGLCFDTGHFNLFSKVSLKDWLGETLQYIRELHLHNNDRTSDQHASIGKGTFDMAGLLNAFEGRPCIYTIEAHRPEDYFESLRWLEGRSNSKNLEL